MNDKDKLSYTIEEAAAALGIGRTQVYKEINAGRLTVLKAGKRTLVPKDAMQLWLGNLPRSAVRSVVPAKAGAQ